MRFMRLPAALFLFAALAISVPATAQEPASGPPGIDEITWVNPPESLSPGVSHHAFRSDALGRDVGYTIYLPPSYEGGTDVFPVIYWLHGRGGNESDVRPSVALHAAIEAGRAQPMVLVTVNGGAGSGYFNNPGTGVLSESLIIRDLIPHIEETYRVSGEQSGRGVAGFSMGGAGAVRLVLRNRGVFGSFVSFGGMLIPQAAFMAEHALNDRDFATDHDVYALAVNSLASLRGVGVQFYVGTADQFLADNRRFATHLEANDMSPGYQEIPGLEHNLADYLTAVGDDTFRFFSDRLAPGS
jgi:S-formylglutathione hydrolase FrmB